MKGERFTVTTTAVKIVDGTQNSGPPYAMSGIIKNPTGGNDTFLGGSTVTTATGYLLSGGDVIAADIVGDGDSIYAICATSQVIHVLRRGA